MCHSGGLDLAKSVFQVHGADASGAVLFRKKLRRHQVLTFFAAQPPCTVAMEACGSAHHWAREIGRLGHVVRLIPPAYVKPFVKRQKNDAADAEAICEAAQRPTMRFMVPKSEQAQAAAMGGVRTGKQNNLRIKSFDHWHSWDEACKICLDFVIGG